MNYEIIGLLNFKAHDPHNIPKVEKSLVFNPLRKLLFKLVKSFAGYAWSLSHDRNQTLVLPNRTLGKQMHNLNYFTE